MKKYYCIKYKDIFDGYGLICHAENDTPVLNKIFDNETEALKEAFKFKYKITAIFFLWLFKILLKNNLSIKKLYIYKVIN